jgi:hypothetical protein
MDFNDIRNVLQEWGIWSVLVLLLLKFVTGVLVAVQKNEFKWYYLGNIFKGDMVKLLTFAILTGVTRYVSIPELENDATIMSMGAVLFTDLLAGVIKNLAHLSAGFAENVPSSLREPARLRLGNSRNTN